MPSDHSLVSNEEHEMKYLLRKWNKKQSVKNQETLRDKLKEFKATPGYEPHNRKKFYEYIKNFNILDLLEDKGNRPAKTRNILIILLIAIIFIILFILWFNKASKNKNYGNEKIKVNIEQKEDISKSKKNNSNFDKLTEIISKNTPIYFLADKAILKDGEKNKIDTITAYLKNQKDIKLIIMGHTASIGVKKNEKLLSVKRAEYIKNLISEKINNQDISIDTKGYGSTKEAIKNPNKKEMRKNRRVEINAIQENK